MSGQGLSGKSPFVTTGPRKLLHNHTLIPSTRSSRFGSLLASLLVWKTGSCVFWQPSPKDGVSGASR
jgi:hypothetical protein